ncbi:MAG TPA: efflux RND transporter periplasmic adaptor subunit [Burkholderiales bacterium]|nr:efflux RND transporter periplasmic adaptor subunit [Burkholderiales bacterium]
MILSTRRFYVTLLFVVALSACHKTQEPQAPPPPALTGETITFAANSPQLAVIKSAVAEPTTDVQLRLSGRLVLNEERTVRIFPPVAGRVTRILAVPGKIVQAGETLALISSPDFGQAQAESRKAAADLALAEKNLERMRELHANGIIATKDLQTAEADVARSKAERERTLAREKLYGSSSNIDQQFALKSPLSGVVVERNLNPGQEVRPDQSQPGSPALFVVSDVTKLWFILDAPEALLPLLRPGVALTLRPNALPGETFSGKVEWLSDAIDPATRALRMRGSIDNRERRLKAEMFVTAKVALPSETKQTIAVRIPADAVLLIGDKRYVFIDEGDGRFRRQPIAADELGPRWVLVRDGLKTGQKVVTEGSLLLQQLLAGGSK